MKKKLLFIIASTCVVFSYAQVTCATLNGPFAGDMDVPVDTVINWTAVDDTDSYIISIGTTPGGTDIVDNRSISSTSFKPPLGLPENTDVYVTLSLFYFDAETIECGTERFSTVDVTTPPPCTLVTLPMDSAVEVDVRTQINWEYAPTAEGYRISIGTSQGGNELVDNIDVGNELSYIPETQFPFETVIYVNIIPYNTNGSAPLICPQVGFTTELAVILPSCSQVISPEDGATDVLLTPLIQWTEIEEADGYWVTIGSSPETSEILNRVAYVATSTKVLDFEPGRTFYLTVIPFNSAGEALNCEQTSFSTAPACVPYFDEVTGEMITTVPSFDFPDKIFICEDEFPYGITAPTTARVYRWTKTNANGQDELISTTPQAILTEPGEYQFVAYNSASNTENSSECESSKRFLVVTSEKPTITTIETELFNGIMQAVVKTMGDGDYEYALDNVDGPYQDSNTFTNIDPSSYLVYVRDKNGCGIVSKDIIRDLTLNSFPNFFSPNGDGINDFWQFIPPVTTREINVGDIHIYDKYGNLLKQLDPLEIGWDGNINGKPMPSADYWFTAVSLTTQKKLKGHFALKR